jgi:hypothetical protein
MSTIVGHRIDLKNIVYIQFPAKVMAVRIPLLNLVITSLLSRLDQYLFYQIEQWNDHLKSNKKKVISNTDFIFILLPKTTSIIIKFIYNADNFFLKQNFRKFLIELEIFCISVNNASSSLKKWQNSNIYYSKCRTKDIP